MRVPSLLVGLVIGLLCVAIPARAFAKPRLKIAVAPFQGDTKNRVAQAVADSLAGKDFVVVGPKDVAREMTKLGLSGELSTKNARKLTTRLGVTATIDGSLGTDGRRQNLHLQVYRRGKPPSGFTVEFKTTASGAFRRAVRDEIIAKLEGASDQDPDDEDEDEVARRAAARQADDDRKRKLSDDDAAATRRAADDDERRRTSEAATRRTRSQSGDTAKRSDRKRLSDDDERPRKPRKPDAELTPVLARAAAGASVAQRNLTFETRAGFTQVPPRVITTAPSGRVDAEIYPVALVRPKSKWLAPLGLAAAYDKTLFLSVQLPNQPLRAPISQSHYSLGTRYRLILADIGTITFGLDYTRRKYIADRSGLMAVVLDAPDVDYSAISPSAAAYLPITPKVAAFGGLGFLLMLETGPIQNADSYGPANAYGIETLAGVDIAVAKRIALRVAFEYSYINLSFKGQGAMATSRDSDPATTDDVKGAADRSIGVAATLGVFY